MSISTPVALVIRNPRQNDPACILAGVVDRLFGSLQRCICVLVGGSVVIPMQSQPFTMTANFHTGLDKKGTIKTIVFEGIQCVSDGQ